ncbi:MAG: exodeoxyribonuclease VII large subunit [Chloroflexi bacterium]|nr:exodeoxyribonuclease VII large subunit [Chloroflexota bacterium]MCH7641987.1 exodeoxyribonuclease VII large subunit [Chloroflexota bacterium]
MTTQTALTVSQVANYLKDLLEADPILADLWVTGEVSNHVRAGSGHHYFTLRDAEGAIRCVQFRPARGSEFLQDGAQVLAHGRISIYTVRGDLQFYVDQVKPEGVGALQQAFEELQRQLDAEGLFGIARKRELPGFPRRIGVVTSPTGAVIQDITNVLQRRYPLAELVLAATPVQGDSAAPGIVNAIGALNSEPGIDVIIIARGGGSIEDLWAFNEEIVARAIFASDIPIVSGVGHETDVTIADLVADVRAPTPSAAAELVAPDRRELTAAVAGFAQTLSDRTSRLVSDQRMRLEQAVDRLGFLAPDTRMQRQRVDDLLRAAGQAVGRSLDIHRERLRSLERQLSTLDPSAILARGYAVVRGEDGATIKSIAGLAPGDSLDLALADGEVSAEIRSLRPRRGDGPSAR